MEKKKMRKVKVQITEILQRIVEVDAYDSSDACERVETMCEEEEIVLDWDDFKTRNFEPYEDK